MVLSIANKPENILERTAIPTRGPQETLNEMASWLSDRHIDALGIACFGPIQLNESSERYGWITKTPKLDWIDTPILPFLRERLNVPAMIDTDVNAAALAEFELGAAKGLNSCVYVTVGTGVGGGIVSEGRLIHGLMHPELGHIPLRAVSDDPAPDGFCPYHKGCLEGLTCGPSIYKRWGVNANLLPVDHPAWELEAKYLAQMCVSLICTVSPQKIILGGGVMQQKQLFPMIRKEVQLLLNGYIDKTEILADIDHYIIEPGLGINSGAIGALLLAQKALE